MSTTFQLVGGHPRRVVLAGTFAECRAAYLQAEAQLLAGDSLYIRRHLDDDGIEVRLDLRGDIAPTGGQHARVRRVLSGAGVLSPEEIATAAQLPYDVTVAALRSLVASGDVNDVNHYCLTVQGRAVMGP